MGQGSSKSWKPMVNANMPHFNRVPSNRASSNFNLFFWYTRYSVLVLKRGPPLLDLFARGAAEPCERWHRYGTCMQTMQECLEHVLGQARPTPVRGCLDTFFCFFALAMVGRFVGRSVA